MRKKFRTCVRPGVDEVRARPRTPNNELIKLDLPTLDLPRNAISGMLSRGQSASFSALLRNSALVIFMVQRAPPSICTFDRLRLAGSLGAHFRELRHPLAHAGHASFDVRHSLDHGLEVLQKFRIVEHRANIL